MGQTWYGNIGDVLLVRHLAELAMQWVDEQVQEHKMGQCMIQSPDRQVDSRKRVEGTSHMGGSAELCDAED